MPILKKQRGGRSILYCDRHRAFKKTAPEAERADNVVDFPAAPKKVDPKPDDAPKADALAKAEAEGPTYFSAATLAGLPIPKRDWLVPGLIPCNTVTMLSGDGGVGKSLLVAQLAVALATGREWIGIKPRRGPVVFLSAEDDVAEIHRRLAEIAASQGLHLADLCDLYIVPRAGRDAVLGAPEAGKTGIIKKTPLWDDFERLVADIRPSLVVLDTSADVFSGNEIVRTEVRQFIGILRGLAIDKGTAVLLLAHPSLTGMSSGRGTSGSTAWNNSVRSRLYLDRVLEPDNFEPDKSLRVLRVMKANYAETGGEIQIRWSNGAFVRESEPSAPTVEGEPLDPSAVGAETEREKQDFMTAIERNFANGVFLQASPASPKGYAPKALVAAEGGKDRVARISTYKRIMDELLDEKRIVSEQYGSKSANKWRLRVVSRAVPDVSENDEDEDE